MTGSSPAIRFPDLAIAASAFALNAAAWSVTVMEKPHPFLTQVLMMDSHRYRPSMRIVMRSLGNPFFSRSRRRFAAFSSQSCLSYFPSGFSMNSVISGRRIPSGVTTVAWSAVYMYSTLPSPCVLRVECSSGEADVCQWTPSTATRKLGQPLTGANLDSRPHARFLRRSWPNMRGGMEARFLLLLFSM